MTKREEGEPTMTVLTQLSGDVHVRLLAVLDRQPEGLAAMRKVAALGPRSVTLSSASLLALAAAGRLTELGGAMTDLVQPPPVRIRPLEVTAYPDGAVQAHLAGQPYGSLLAPREGESDEDFGRRVRAHVAALTTALFESATSAD